MGATPIYGGFYKWGIIKDNCEGRFSDAVAMGQPRPEPLLSTAGGWASLLVVCVAPELLWLNSAVRGVFNYLEYSSTLRNLAIRMADVQSFVKTIERVSSYIAASPDLEAIYGSRLKATRKLLAMAKEDTEVGGMIKHLLDLPYKKWSYFFNNAGKLLASHTLFVEYKNEFADAMYELGQLDAYLGVAVLFDSSKKYDGHHSFTFTKFLDRRERDTPYVKLQDMWNPFMDARQAVDNDVEMGGAVKHITLTGPNAGGKSTFLTGVTLSLVLSQTFGIAPAKEAVITPFDKISTYIDITDDLSAGTSLFMAEVKRAQEHIKIIKGLKRGEFAFTIFDEPFSGTNPLEGGAAEYSILKALGNYPNHLSVVATHYPIVILLEKKKSILVLLTTKFSSQRIKTYYSIPIKSSLENSIKQ